MKLKKIVFAMGLLGLATASPSVFAEDGKVHPGGMCVPASPSQWSNFFLSGGRLFSLSDNVTVHCPIVRDNVTNTNGTNRARVQVISSGGGVACSLRSMSKDGVLIENSGAFGRFNSGEIFLDVNRSQASGYYYLQCGLARNTGIASYQVDEP